ILLRADETVSVLGLFEPANAKPHQGLAATPEKYPPQFTDPLNWPRHRERGRKLKQKSPSARAPKGSCERPVGATRRLLNLLSLVSASGKSAYRNWSAPRRMGNDRTTPLSSGGGGVSYGPGKAVVPPTSAATPGSALKPGMFRMPLS